MNETGEINYATFQTYHLYGSSLILLPVSGFTQTANEQGLEIAQEMDRRNEGFGDSTAKLTMTLKNKAGRESFRYIRFKTFEVKGGW